MRHIENARFQEGDNIGTKAQVLVHTTLGEAGKIRTLFHQFLGKNASLATFNPSASLVQVFDVRTKFFVKIRIISAVHGHFRTDGTLRYGAEIDARNRPIRKHIPEIRLSFVDGGTCVPIKADAHAFAHRACPHTRLTIHIAGVECQAHDLEMRLAS